MASKTPPAIEQPSQDARALTDVVNSEPDFACVLITGSFLDQCLASLLRKFFVKCSTADGLLSFKGPLGTFASRVNLCYGLGLITKEMRQNLETIGEIRNLFGHSHLSLGFNDQDIKTLCGKLTFPKVHIAVGGDGTPYFTKITGARNRFSLIAFMLANRLLLTGLATTPKERQTEGWE
jgi:hypothetical protein